MISPFVSRTSRSRNRHSTCQPELGTSERVSISMNEINFVTDRSVNTPTVAIDAMGPTQDIIASKQLDLSAHSGTKRLLSPRRRSNEMLVDVNDMDIQFETEDDSCARNVFDFHKGVDCEMDLYETKYDLVPDEIGLLKSNSSKSNSGKLGLDEGELSRSRDSSNSGLDDFSERTCFKGHIPLPQVYEDSALINPTPIRAHRLEAYLEGYDPVLKVF